VPGGAARRHSASPRAERRSRGRSKGLHRSCHLPRGWRAPRRHRHGLGKQSNTAACQAVEKPGSACQPAPGPQPGRRKVAHRPGDRRGSLLCETPFRLSKGFSTAWCCISEWKWGSMNRHAGSRSRAKGFSTTRFRPLARRRRRPSRRRPAQRFVRAERRAPLCISLPSVISTRSSEGPVCKGRSRGFGPAEPCRRRLK